MGRGSWVMSGGGGAHLLSVSAGEGVGWRPRTTVGFAGPGKSITGSNVATSAGPPLMDGACCVFSPHGRAMRRRWWWTSRVGTVTHTRKHSARTRERFR